MHIANERQIGPYKRAGRCDPLFKSGTPPTSETDKVICGSIHGFVRGSVRQNGPKYFTLDNSKLPSRWTVPCTSQRKTNWRLRALTGRCDPLFKFGPPSATDEARHFKFGMQVDCGKY